MTADEQFRQEVFHRRSERMLNVMAQAQLVSDALELLLQLEMELRAGWPVEPETLLERVQRVIGSGA